MLKIIILALALASCAHREPYNANRVIITPWRPTGCHFIQTITFKGHDELNRKAHMIGGEVAAKKGPGVADVYHCDDRRAK